VLYRREEKKRIVQGTAIRERRRWVGGLIHDLQNSIGAVQANFEFLAQELASAGRVSSKSEVEECVQDCRSLFRDMARGLRTVLDYERFESDRIALREEQVFLADLAEKAKAVIESSTAPITRPSPSRVRPTFNLCRVTLTISRKPSRT